MFKLKKDPQFEDSEVPFLRQKRYHFRYHFENGIILGIILGKKVSFLPLFGNKNVPFLEKNELKRYLYFFKKVPTGTYKSPDETHIYIYMVINEQYKILV